MLELADGTELPTYQSPHLPFERGADWSDPVCNLYSMLKSQEAMRRLFDGLTDRAGNMPPRHSFRSASPPSRSKVATSWLPA